MADEIDNEINAFKGKKVEKELPAFFKFTNEGDYVRGIITNFRKIRGKMGMQDICDIGIVKSNIENVLTGRKYSLTVTKALESLFDYENMEVLVIFKGKKILANGREFNDFEIYAK